LELGEKNSNDFLDTILLNLIEQNKKYKLKWYFLWFYPRILFFNF
jgi:hypothetical protein